MTSIAVIVARAMRLDPSNEEHLAMARAAIGALRAPTDLMIYAGYDAVDGAITHPGVESVFEAMIDAALAE